MSEAKLITISMDEYKRLEARVAELETALERIVLRGYEVVREEHRIARAALEGK